jgi:hypothetical protein
MRNQIGKPIGVNAMSTLPKSNTNGGLINLIIGLSLLAFTLMLALFILGIIFKLAPVLGFFVAVGGGIWYFQAKDDHAKLRAAQTVAAGLIVMFVFGAIF